MDRRIIEGLIENRNLTEVNLGLVADAGVEFLAEAFGKFTKLTHITLTENPNDRWSQRSKD